MNIKPLNDKIVIQPIEEKISSFLHIPDVAKKESQLGKVVAVGRGRLINNEVVPPEVKVGDVVYFPKYGGVKVEVDGVKLEIFAEEELIGVLE